MKAILSIGSLVGLLGSIAVACSSTPAPVVPDATVAAFCSDWANAYCQLSSICQFDVTSCQTFQTQVCNTFATAAQASGDRTYSQPAGKTCIEQLTAAFAGGPPSIPAATLDSLTDTCNLAFVGNQALNASCTDDYDCQAGFICGTVPNENAECSVASPKTIAGEGCADHGDQCQGNLYCAASSNGPVCTATPALGGQCSATVPCGTGAYCAAGICTATGGVGQTCTSTEGCQTGLFCDTYPPAQCVNALTFARGSDDCNGIAGTNEPTGTGADASVTPTPDSSTSEDSSTTPDTGASDAATGG